MKYKLYIVTYKNLPDIQENISSIKDSDFYSRDDIGIFIINNSPSISLKTLENSKITVLDNNLRPEFSTGHLSRNWNQALINGFQSLVNPQAELVMHSQDDVKFEPGWFNQLLGLHNKFDFINLGVGDAFCSYTIKAVQTIGLWDERFCGIGYQEADYFMRCLIALKNKSSINDLGHKRILNPIPGNFFNSTRDARHGGNYNLLYVPGKNDQRMMEHHRSGNMAHELCRKMLYSKYGTEVKDVDWNVEYLEKEWKILNTQPVLYPYFEGTI
ncbi:MAG TPA: glycosyltransferase family A protein [Saprospiraceae bacterium]|nr:glycosyltransferase family A protein [Saprospiraceae bacterium]